MARSMTAALLAEYKSAALKPIFLVALTLNSGLLRMWTGVGDLVFDGNTYTGVGSFGGFSNIEETADIKSSGVDLILTGVPLTQVAEIRNSFNHGTDVTIWGGALNSSFALIADPLQIFKGKLDSVVLEETSGTAVITVRAESDLVDLKRPRERRYTDEDQRNLFSGDEGLEYIAELQDKEITF